MVCVGPNNIQLCSTNFRCYLILAHFAFSVTNNMLPFELSLGTPGVGDIVKWSLVYFSLVLAFIMLNRRFKYSLGGVKEHHHGKINCQIKEREKENDLDAQTIDDSLFYSLGVFRSIPSWGSFTGVWVTVSLLRFPKLFQDSSEYSIQS